MASRKAFEKLIQYEKQSRKRVIRHRVVRIVGCLILFCTILALCLPAATLEYGDITYCGLEEHTHSESCYELVLTCGYEETAGSGEATETSAAHVHSASCYEMREVLVCGQEEAEPHTHTEECYTAVRGELICGNEDEDHEHTDKCYAWTMELTCGLEETEGHTHTEECYETQTVLVCGMEELSEEESASGDGSGENTADNGEASGHVHTEDCYESVLICGMEEHTHTLACYSDPTADLETAADWEATLPAELTCNWAADLLAVAKSQLGYTESTANYLVLEDGETVNGYTSYGAWYGDPYGDWSAMFVSFCLHYAGTSLEAAPFYACSLPWADLLGGQQNGDCPYVDAAGYIPSAGDLVFLDTDGDGTADRCGIVAAYSEPVYEEICNEETGVYEMVETEAPQLVTIQGDVYDAVQYVIYSLPYSGILGYAVLPENTAVQTAVTAEGGDYTVTVTYGAEAKLPDNLQLVAEEYSRDSETWSSCYAGMTELYGWDGNGEYARTFRLFRIAFYADGEKVEPASAVCVTVTYTDWNGSYNVHVFSYGGEEAETVSAYDAGGDGGLAVKFKAASGGIYGILLTDAAADAVNAMIDALPALDVFYETLGAYEDADDYDGYNAYQAAVKEQVSEACGAYNALTYSQQKQIKNKDLLAGLADVLDLEGISDRNPADSNVVIDCVHAGSGHGGGDGTEAEQPDATGGTAADGTGSTVYMYNGMVSVSEGDSVTVSVLHSPFHDVTPVYSDDGYVTATFTDGGSDTDTLVINGIRDTSELPGGYVTVTLTQSGSGETSTLVLYVFVGSGATEAYSDCPYCHLDISVDADFVIQICGGDGTAVTVKPSDMQLLNVEATIYNTAADAGLSWAELDGAFTEDHKSSAAEGDYYRTDFDGATVQAVDVNFDQPAGGNNGVFTVASVGGHGGDDAGVLAFYDGDTAALRFTIAYTYDGASYYIHYTAVCTVAELFNACASGDAADSTRGFDISVVIDDFIELGSSALQVTDMYGDTLEGAVFAFYAADETYAYLTDGAAGTYITLEGYDWAVDSGTGVISVYSGDTLVYTITPALVCTADSGGSFIFADGDGVSMTLEALKDAVGSERILMREISVPDGYRLMTEAAELYVENGALMCANPYGSGVYAASSAVVTASGTLYGVDGSTYTYYTDDDGIACRGALYAVVMAETDGGWAAVAGDTKTVIASVDDAAAFIENNADSVYPFELGASGFIVTASVTELAGDIDAYYPYLVSQGGEDNAAYTIAYFYEKEDGNWFCIDGEASGFSVQWTATIEVSNQINQLFVQKLNEAGALVNDAVFALYPVYPDAEGEDTSVWYIADDGTYIFLYPDDGGDADDGIAGNNQGTACLYADAETAGTYTADGETGIITVTIEDAAYTITPVEVETTLGAADDRNLSGEDGTAVFTSLSEGDYYLREIYAPDTCFMNTSEIMVAVTDSAVLAHAGTADNGVTVAWDAGFLLTPLARFAALDGEDNTLSWLYGVLKTTEADAGFEAAAGQASYDGVWHYITENYWDGSADAWTTAEDGSAGADAAAVYLTYSPESAAYDYDINTGRSRETNFTGTARLYTAVGWSWLELRQDSEYGMDAAAANGAAYSVLSGMASEQISSLCSGAVYVQVTGAQGGSLEIRNTVVDADGSGGSDQTFSYHVMLFSSDLAKDEEGYTVHPQLTEAYAYTVYDIAVDAWGSEIRTAAVDEAGNDLTGMIVSGGVITLKDGQAAVIEKLPGDALYTIVEANPGNYAVEITVTGGGDDADGTITGRIASGQLGEADVNHTSSVAVNYTNSYAEYVDIAVGKTDAGGGMMLTGAEFVLYYAENGVNYYYRYDEELSAPTWQALAAGETESVYALTTVPDGTLIFPQVVSGVYYLKEVTAPEGYVLLSDVIAVHVTNGTVRVLNGLYTVKENTGYVEAAAFAEDTVYYTRTEQYVRVAGVTAENFQENVYYTYDGETDTYTEATDYEEDAVYYAVSLAYTEASNVTEENFGAGVYYTAADGDIASYIITVPNNTSYELPGGGGNIGRALVYAAAAALIFYVFTGLIFVGRRKRESEHEGQKLFVRNGDGGRK